MIASLETLGFEDLRPPKDAMEGQPHDETLFGQTLDDKLDPTDSEGRARQAATVPQEEVTPDAASLPPVLAPPQELPVRSEVPVTGARPQAPEALAAEAPDDSSEPTDAASPRVRGTVPTATLPDAIAQELPANDGPGRTDPSLQAAEGNRGAPGGEPQTSQPLPSRIGEPARADAGVAGPVSGVRAEESPAKPGVRAEESPAKPRVRAGESPAQPGAPAEEPPVPAGVRPRRDAASTSTPSHRSGTDETPAPEELDAPGRRERPLPPDAQDPSFRTGSPELVPPVRERALSTPAPLAAAAGSTDPDISVTVPGIAAPTQAAAGGPGPLSPSAPPLPAEALPVHVEWLAQRGGGRARLDLHPPHLGRVEISVRVRGSEVEVAIAAPESAAQALVSGQRDTLEEALAARDLRLSQFQVGSGARDETNRDAGDGRPDGAFQYAAPSSETRRPRDLRTQQLGELGRNRSAPQAGRLDLHA